MSSDGVVIASDNICLNDISNAVETFSSPVKSFSGLNESCTDNFLIPDFTLEQIRSLRVNQSDQNRNQQANGLLQLFGIEGGIRQAKIGAANGRKSINGNEPPVGLAFEIYNSAYYQETYGLDIVAGLIQVLRKYNIGSVKGATDNGIPVVITSWDSADLERLSKMTDLPLVQNVFFNNPDYTYDLSAIGQYAHGVKTDIGNLLWYPVTSKTDLSKFDTSSYSDFVSECHANNLSVFAAQLKDDAVEYTDSIEEELAMVVAKGVDGIFSDFTYTSY
jgi:glycerophosphoryl diester phosphodiesterase